MSGSAANLPAAPPKWLPWAFLALLVVPFHPLWVDFEQVRRGLLLVAAGASLVGFRSLPAARGERALWWLLGLLAASAAINFVGQSIGATDTRPLSFQPWEAAYRLAHWFALVVALRLGAAQPDAFGTPLAATLLATSLFGLLQHLGLAEIAGYGARREPVSVFGNLNVASEATAVFAAAVAVVSGRRPLAFAAIAAAAAYLVVNESRSGLVALPLGLVLLTVVRRKSGGLLPLAVAAGGALLGVVLALGLPRPDPVDTSAVVAEQKRGTVTLGVRVEIANGSTKLFGESPLFGQGPGQFAIQYPRVRSQDEIEMSSHGRKFASEVRTAHDDWIEILVEGGLPGLVLFALVLFALQRGAPDRSRQVPLFVFLLLMLVRSPLGNAPAAAVAFLLVGRADAARAPARRRRTIDAVLGVVLCVLGALPLIGNTLATPYLAARAAGEHPPRAAIEHAAACMPFEPRWLQLLAQEQMIDGDLAGAASTAARALKLRPFDPVLYVLLGEILARGGRVAEAGRIARHALGFDPANPELRVLLSTMQCRAQKPELAIEAVVQKPHPVLRARLADHFRDLGVLAERDGDAAGAARYRVERSFLQAVDGLGDSTPAGLAATDERMKALLAATRDAGLVRKDMRWLAVGGLYALDLGNPETAIEQGAAADTLGIAMPGWQRDLFGEKLAPLERIEAWQRVLARR